MKYDDLKLLADEDAAKLVPIAKKNKKLYHINLTTISAVHPLIPRLSFLKPRSGDYALCESSGKIIHFMGNLSNKKMIDNPRDEGGKHYPGFRGGAKRPTTEFRYIKIPGGHKHIIDEPGLSTFVKTRYTITFTHNGKKKKQIVWARDQKEAFDMIRDLYPGIKGELKKNPRGAGVPVDQIQLNLMMDSYFNKIAYPDSSKERVAIRKLVQSSLMEITPQDDTYKLTSRGRKLLSEYLKEQEKYT